ncbi:hypothetical protein GCM10009673_19630 [Nesterenkonia sandarakina]
MAKAVNGSTATAWSASRIGGSAAGVIATGGVMVVFFCKGFSSNAGEEGWVPVPLCHAAASRSTEEARMWERFNRPFMRPPARNEPFTPAVFSVTPRKPADGAGVGTG